MTFTPPPDADAPRWALGDRSQHLPPGTGELGMYLFLAALVMLFAASLVGYLAVRLNVEQAPPPGSIDIPRSLWFSTALLLLSSLCIHRAVIHVRQERQTRFRRAILATWLTGMGFLLVQIPSLAALLREHYRQTAEYEPATYLYGLIFALILLHGLHVLGGLLPLLIVTLKAHRGAYDHEHYSPVRYVAMYWHFLDGVWLVLFGIFMFIA
jgi:cytochrome c oxidase subunit 3